MYCCHFSVLNTVDVSLTQGWTGSICTYCRAPKDPQPSTGRYDWHTFCSGLTCAADISLIYWTLTMFFSLEVWLGVCSLALGRLRIHSQWLVSVIDTHFVVGMHVRLSFLYSTECVSLTQGWTWVFLCMTKDSQLGTGLYCQHTLCRTLL